MYFNYYFKYTIYKISKVLGLIIFLENILYGLLFLITNILSKKYGKNQQWYYKIKFYYDNNFSIIDEIAFEI